MSHPPSTTLLRVHIASNIYSNISNTPPQTTSPATPSNKAPSGTLTLCQHEGHNLKVRAQMPQNPLQNPCQEFKFIQITWTKEQLLLDKITVLHQNHRITHTRRVSRKLTKNTGKTLPWMATKPSTLGTTTYNTHNPQHPSQ